MNLKDCITIEKRFRKAVNLQLDLGSGAGVREYIPTKSSLVILRRYMEIVTGMRRENANILIGPYGKGKSHLLLVLLELLGGRTGERADFVRELSGQDDALAAMIEGYWAQDRPLLPVLISASGNDLNEAFLIALREALAQNGLGDLTPKSDYTEAVAAIRGWERDFPDTYRQFGAELGKAGETMEAFIRKLELADRRSLALFAEIYPRLTAGSVFRPMVTQEAFTVYRQMNRQLYTEYGYGGIYIVFDEFSKFIEGHGETGFAANMKVLQDICELAGGSTGEKLFLTLVTHKSIHEYTKTIPSHMQNLFRAVEGRLTEIRFVVSARNNYELIADTLKKNEPAFSDGFVRMEKEPAVREIREESFQTPCFSALFSWEEYERVMLRGCFPLTPLCAYALLHLCERIAQNERTIFTFLANDEDGSLSRLMERGARGYIGIAALYDYFHGVLREIADAPFIHNEWLKAEYALTAAETADEREVVKALAIVRMIHREDEFSARDDVLRLALGMERSRYEEAMQGLVSHRLVVYRSSLGMYAFQNHVGVDVDAEIQKEAAGMAGSVDLCAVLGEVSELRFLLPKKYNHDHAMTRFFRYRFLTPETFLALPKAEYLFEENFSDGVILALVSEGTIHPEAIFSHLKDLGEERLIAVVPEKPFSQRENVQKLLAVQALREKDSFVEENRALLQELNLYEEDLLFEINAALEHDFLPGGANRMFDRNGALSETAQKVSFNQQMSDVLEHYFQDSPRVNHELLNIQNVSGQYLRARNRVVEAVLTGADVSAYRKGTSPEAMIYKAAFVRTGVIAQSREDGKEAGKPEAYVDSPAGDDKNEGGRSCGEAFKNGGILTEPVDAGCAKLIDCIRVFMRECAGKRVSFSVLYARVQGRELGVRKGILPLFLAYCFSSCMENATVYLGARELPVTAELLNRVNDHPESYELFLEEKAVEKEQYLLALEECFGARQMGGKGGTRMNRICSAMQRWYRSLPQYTMVTVSVGGEAPKTVRVMRGFLRRAELNPREFLMERLPEAAASDEKNLQKMDVDAAVSIAAAVVETGQGDVEQKAPDIHFDENKNANSDLKIYEKTARVVIALKSGMDQAYALLQERVAQRMKLLFGAKAEESLCGCLRDWYQRQTGGAESEIHGTAAKSWLCMLSELSTNDEGMIVERASRSLLEIFLQDWTDASEEAFFKKLAEVKGELEQAAAAQDSSGRNQIVITDADGNQVRRFYQADVDDSTAYYLKNMIEEALEDFGSSLEDSQKVAVLVDAIRGLL